MQRSDDVVGECGGSDDWPCPPLFCIGCHVVRELQGIMGQGGCCRWLVVVALHGPARVLCCCLVFVVLGVAWDHAAMAGCCCWQGLRAMRGAARALFC